jgi:hypothetical protein
MELTSSVEKLSRIILAQDAEMWLISLDKHHIDDFISLQKQMETNLQELTSVKEAVTKAKESKTNKVLRHETEAYYYGNFQEHQDDDMNQEDASTHIMLPSTRSMAKHTKNVKKRSSNATLENSHGQQSSNEDNTPVISEGRIKWKRTPREPIPQLSDINLWVGQQLRHANMPTKYLNLQPKGNLIPRIIVPPAEIKTLILQTHEDIHHQNHLKVLHVLKATYDWPNMAKDIERWCTSSCDTCATATVRRKHLKSKFDLTSPQATMGTRQHYGIEFYGLNQGEILVIVDLSTRETILVYLRNRNQDTVAKTIIKNIIFQRGVPLSLRTDNAPELSSVTGAVSAICKYLNIKQIRTGGHNPRGNTICERVNQSLGVMIRKLNDYEYGKLELLSLPAFQFALNTTYNSAIGCTPFEAGHGLNATTISQARITATKASILAEGGRDGDILEDVDEFFDKSLVKDQFELAMRMAEVTRSTSEWHRRMTSENLSQSGQLVDLTHMPIGAEAYIYKPPSQQEAINKGRRVKHVDHYIGPGRIVRHIGTRSVVVSIKDHNNVDREYQRDAGMVLLRKPKPEEVEPEFTRERSQGTRASSKNDLIEHPIREGEFLILKDDPGAKDWYCAEVRAVLVVLHHADAISGKLYKKFSEGQKG